MKVKVKRLAGSHSVALTCTGPAGVMFNFYRGPAAGGESSTPLNASPLGTCDYTDTAVVGAHTYFYTAKSTCTTCVNGGAGLSGPSNEVQAAIPSDSQPNPPVLSVGTIAQTTVPLIITPPAAQTGVKVNSYNIMRCHTADCTNAATLATITGKNYTTQCPVVTKQCWYTATANDTIAGASVITDLSNIVLAQIQ